MEIPFDGELAQRYGAYASYRTEASPAQVEYFGENPADEVDRLIFWRQPIAVWQR